MHTVKKFVCSAGAILLTAALALAPFVGESAAAPKKRLKVPPETKSKQVKLDLQPLKLDLKGEKTSFIDFDTAPFPYDGKMPGSSARFLNVTKGKRKGHQTKVGGVLWQDTTFGDRRVLLHIPKDFDLNRPAVMIVFFHGHLATLRRDVSDRQKVPAQISASGINAVLVAPQFAFNARDSSAGKFWEPGAFQRFVAEASNKLAEMNGDPRAAQAFAKIPIVIVAYSGGYLPTAWCLKVGGVESRVRGVVLLDALYGEVDRFASWIASHRSTFFVSAYTESTQRKNAALKSMLRQKEIPYGTNLQQSRWQNGVTFLSTNSKIGHWDFVTQAWADYPIKDLLSRLEEYRR